MKKTCALLAALFAVSSAPASAQQPPGEASNPASAVSSEFQQGRPQRRRALQVVVGWEDLDARLLRLETLLAEPFDYIGDMQYRERLREARRELRGIREVLLAAPDVRRYSPPPPSPPPPPPPPAVNQPVTDQTLRWLMESLSSKSFADEKLQVLERLPPQFRFVVPQLQQILSQFPFANDRLNVVRLLWPRIMDPRNGYLLYDSFEFSSDKKRLEKLISN